MKPIISEKEYKQLSLALRKKKVYYQNFLKSLMQRLQKVKDFEVHIKTVRLNSIVELWHSLLQKVVKFKIVMPRQANLSKKNLSVFSPIAMALLGHKENDIVFLEGQGVDKQLRIIKVTNE
jgi:transcription elongation GreA/GreB family factor